MKLLVLLYQVFAVAEVISIKTMSLLKYDQIYYILYGGI